MPGFFVCGNLDHPFYRRDSGLPCPGFGKIDKKTLAVSIILRAVQSRREGQALPLQMRMGGGVFIVKGNHSVGQVFHIEHCNGAFACIDAKALAQIL